MKCIRTKVETALRRGNIHCNHDCEYHPCHFKGQNCSFCYCPFYLCNDGDLGTEIHSRKTDEPIWDCSPCLFNHRNDVVEYTFKRFSELGISSADDPRLTDVFRECKERFFRRGKALMIVGATSDAGKSLVTSAICRSLSRKGYIVTPFKAQNMSLNSSVTKDGHEISAVQALQCRAAGLTNPAYNVNPVLIKPIGSSRTQVFTDGKPYKEYGVEDYYSEFVPGPGTETVKRNIEFLKKRYDYIIIEGGGSPAEMNIYDKDLANMRTAEIADADCILVVNTDRGGSFAYAAGTVALIPEEDRKRIRGIILNNISGDVRSLDGGIAELERITGVPVIGTLPHFDIDLPKEDSESFEGDRTKENGLRISVIRFPAMVDFTDIDPLRMENTDIRFVTSPEQLTGTDAVILPGSNSPLKDLQWLEETGLSEGIKKLAGKVPILGICGGYEMLAQKLFLPNADGPIEGLSLLKTDMKWGDRTVSSRRCRMNVGDRREYVDGFETHAAHEEDRGCEPLFMIERFSGEVAEGCADAERHVYGTFLHGVFERPGFRRFFIEDIERMKGTADGGHKFADYGDHIEKELDRLADGFEESVDMKAFERILGGLR